MDSRDNLPPGGPAPTPRTVRLSLPLAPPYDADGILGFLADRAIAGVESADRSGAYRRTVRLVTGAAVVDVHFGATEVSCALTVPSAADVPALTDAVRRFLDLDADVAGIEAVLAADPVLRAAVRARPGIRVPGSLEPAETLFRALIGQQISVASARTALGRLVAELGDDVPADGTLVKLFPSPERIAADGRSVLRGPARRIDAIVGVAEALATGAVSLDPTQSVREFMAALQELPGIGPWTAGYVAMRVLGAADILLTGDLALRAGAGRLGLPTQPRRLAARAEAWSPYRSYAGMHLWRAAHP